MISIRQSLQAGKKLLTSKVSHPLLEVEILFAYALKKPRSYLYAHPDQMVSAAVTDYFFRLIERRSCKEPIAYLTGTAEFWSLELFVNAHTLIPRPETEQVVEQVLTLFPQNQEVKVVDLGTGCGAIALALCSECPKWQIYATDLSEEALVIAKKNANQLGLDKIIFKQGDWLLALQADPPILFDVIVSNPPYIAENEWSRYSQELAFEPRRALLAGEDGLRDIHIISQMAKNYLKSDGYLIVEHGFLQGQAVRDLFAKYGYANIASKYDLAGHERITLGQYLA